MCFRYLVVIALLNSFIDNRLKMSKAVDYSSIKKCLIHKTSKDDWDDHLTNLEKLVRKMDVVRNFMSHERNFKISDGQWKLQTLAETLTAREDLISDYTKVFEDGLLMLQEKFREDRQRVYDSQMAEFSEDMLQWKQSHKIVATLLERRQHLKSSQSKDWIRFAKLTDEQDHAYSTWLTKKCQIQEAISNDERKVKIQSLVKTAEIESDRYCELQNQKIALLKPNSDVVKEKELKFEKRFEEFNASTAKWKNYLTVSEESYSDNRHVQFADTEQSDHQLIEQSGVANVDPQILNAESEVSSKNKNSQKDPDDLKDSLTEVSGSLEDPVTDLYKPSETSKDQRNLPSAKYDTLSLKNKIETEPSITSTTPSIRRAEYERAVAERKERE